VFIMAGERELSRGLADDMPTGAAVDAAARDAAALALATLDAGSLDDAEHLLGSTAALVVIAHPAAGSVAVALVAKGRVVELGRLADAPARTH
jgi:hypothetical protein